MSGRKLIVQNWTEDEDVKVDKVDLLQGSIGTHVVNIGGKKFGQSISTPIVIFENYTNTETGLPLSDNPVLDQYGMLENTTGVFPDNSIGVYGILDLLVDYWTMFTDGSLLYNAGNEDFLNLFLINTADLNLNEQGSTLSMSFVSDRKGPFSPVLGYPLANPDQFIGRTAKPWDVTVQCGSFTLPGIMDLKLNFQLVIDDKYFMFPNWMSVTPFFVVKGYQITGSFTSILDATQLNYITGNNPNAYFDPTIMPQAPGRLIVDNVPIAVSYNKINNNDFYNSNAPVLQRNLIVATKSATTKIHKELAGGDLSKVTVSFTCFARPNGLLS